MYGVSRNFDKLRRALSSLFTLRCVCCGKAAADGKCLCADCESDLVPAVKLRPGEGLYFSRFAAKYEYSGGAKTAFLRFKFSGDYRLCSDTVFDWLLSAFDENFSPEEFDFIIPVPAFGGRKARFSTLVKRLAHYREIPFAPELLVKTRKTEKQHNLSAELRKTNLAGAFCADPSVLKKRILLVDDVMTTGNTVNECSKALAAAGAASVAVLTVLKTNPFEKI